VEQEKPDWSDLIAELDRWTAAGQAACLWWRDDDAAAMTPALARLLALSREHRATVHLAAIPARLADNFAAALAGEPHVRVLQHGFAHIDHAPPGAGSWELGDHRPREAVLAELAAGRHILSAAVGARFLPVLVPPWTRIAPSLIPHIGQSGLIALSLEGRRQRRFAAPGIATFNAHCDPIRWKGGARFTGTARALDEIVRHLAARRQGEADADEPTGLCTHHLDHDEATWEFVERLLAEVTAHPGARWIDLAGIMTVAA
jgi:hypothetical protein